MEDAESHPEVTFPEHVFGELETVAMAAQPSPLTNTRHAFLVILLENAMQKIEKYVFVAQNR